MYEPGGVYEVTTRTIREELLLRPSAAVNAIILGVIGRAMFLFPDVKLHYFVAMSNHIHMLLSGSHGESIAGFIGFVNSNIARRVIRLHGLTGLLWGRRARPIRIVDHESMVERLVYQMSQGCKEGLVATPEDWPGASAREGLVGDMTMRGVWHDRNGERRAARGGRAYDPARFRTEYPIELTPLPAFAELDADALRERHRELLGEVVRTTARRNRELGRIVLGAAEVLAQDPHGRPVTVKRSPAPRCHAATAAARAEYDARYDAFVAQFREAADAVRRGVTGVPFPPGSFPCRGRWVPFSAAAA